ncbi:MAG: threonine--tRNA ligase [Lachnoclostridium sp.]|jgi:threonyl-tRNA synthetase|nr:threonine--tRNA ligase [Lachnoclostridium sp.]
MKIILKDGSLKEYNEERSVYDIAKDISEGLARAACAAELDGQVVDLRTMVTEGEHVLNVLTFDSDGGKSAYRHTASHILAQAVKRLYPEAKLAIGPSIKEGFYYDFDTDSFDRAALDEIEKEMKKIIKEGLAIKRFTLPREEAIDYMQVKKETYKVELIEELPEDEEISFYQQGDFVDLCAGPHLMNTKAIKAFKLISSSGAYWKGNEKNKSLVRIYGTAFNKKEDLNAYLEHLEDIKKRDHNRLGREMKLFTTSDVVGQGLPLMMPKGAKMLQILQRWIEDDESKRGYLLTKTPNMAKSELYKLSGHWDHYRDGMFIIGDAEKEEDLLALRPMTCPFQFSIYNAESHSYKELPIRYSETSTLFRNESSGEMHGLIRIRQFTLSDGHIVCTPDQLEQEFSDTISLIKYIMSTLGIEKDITYRFSKWDPNNTEKYINEPEAWENSQKRMKEILDKLKIPYTEAEDEAAFYGPKLDLQFVNVHGKEDTVITIQIDFALGKRLGMLYTDANSEKKHPWIIHRSSIGCYERTLAMLIEKYMGMFPTWLCPEQVRVLPISEKHADYAQRIKEDLQKHQIRAEADQRSEKIGYKIREARLERIPYLLIVGQEEEENETVSLRSRYKGDEGTKVLSEFINEISEEIRTKQIRKIESVS